MDFSALDELLGIVRQSKPEDLMLSRMDCHSRQVSSIVIAKADDGHLLRFFMAWPRHDLHRNVSKTGNFAVGVHDHRYSLRLRRVWGEPTNHLYRVTVHAEPRQGFDWRPERGLGVREMRFGSPLVNGQMHIETRGWGVLRLVSRALIPDDRNLVLAASEFHTVSVPAGQSAIWVAEEGRVVKERTTLFNNERVDVSGFYRTFHTPAQVVAHVERFVHEAKRAADPQAASRGELAQQLASPVLPPAGATNVVAILDDLSTFPSRDVDTSLSAVVGDCAAFKEETSTEGDFL